MDKKGEMNVGTFIVMFIGIITALILYNAIQPYVGQATGEATGVVQLRNSTITVPAVGSSVDLTGQELESTPFVNNQTGGQSLNSGNYTIAEGVTSAGIKGIIYTTSVGSTYVGRGVNVSYGYYPAGYIDNAGGRSMAMLIPLFAILAIILFALEPTLRNGIIDLVGRR